MMPTKRACQHVLSLRAIWQICTWTTTRTRVLISVCRDGMLITPQGTVTLNARWGCSLTIPQADAFQSAHQPLTSSVTRKSAIFPAPPLGSTQKTTHDNASISARQAASLTTTTAVAWTSVPRNSTHIHTPTPALPTTYVWTCVLKDSLLRISWKPVSVSVMRARMARMTRTSVWGNVRQERLLMSFWICVWLNVMLAEQSSRTGQQPGVSRNVPRPQVYMPRTRREVVSLSAM